MHDSESPLYELYTMLDRHNKGTVSLQELRGGLRLCGLQEDDLDVETLLSFVSTISKNSENFGYSESFNKEDFHTFIRTEIEKNLASNGL